MSTSKEFTTDMAAKNKDKAVKFAFDRAVEYLNKDELPNTWDRTELLGISSDEASDDVRNLYLLWLIALLFIFGDFFKTFHLMD